MRILATWLLLLVSVIGVNAQELNILPTMTPAGGSHNNNVDVTCTFPEGCAGGKYWFNGGQIAAQDYTGPIHLEHSTRLSVAGVNEEGRIITDVVTYDFTVDKVAPPFVTTDPEMNTSRESFYVTKIIWNNASSTAIDVSDFKEGGSRHGEKVVWLVYEPTNTMLASSDYNALWQNGNDTYKAYVYKNYRPTDEGAYTLHIASGVFVINGQRYDEELVLRYYIGTDEMTAPEFTPAPGSYAAPLTVSIKYPENAFYQFYKIGEGDIQLYEAPFTITETSTITAWGRTEDYSEETGTTTATYTITEAPHQTESLPMPRILCDGNMITITEEDNTAVIKYWYDDDMSTACLYTAPFEVTRNCKISAVAYREYGLSPTVNYVVDHFQQESSDRATFTLRTPDEWENVHLTGMSPNGRYVCGYVLVGGTPVGFTWDITSGKSEMISTQYNCSPTGISNDGTICGWRDDIDPVTGESVSTSETDLFWGYFHDGVWTRQPRGITAKGITGDNRIFGSYKGSPAVYDIATETMTTYSGGKGVINCMSADGTVAAGYITVDGRKTPVYWTSADDNVIISASRECEVTLISGNGNWMYLDNESWGSYSDLVGYRHNAVTGVTETIVSMGAEYPSRYEWLYSIVDDGTLYGVYDRSLMYHDAGLGLAYTPDGVWRNAADVLAEQRALPEDVVIQSCKYVSADQKTFALTVFPADVSVDDAFSYALALRFDVVVAHAAPVDVKASQMYGVKTVKVMWNAPLTGCDDIVSYKVMRNGEVIATVDASEHTYYDKTTENNGEYVYAVVAVYNDGRDSEPSYPCSVKVMLASHVPARNLSLRQSGINDVNLSWTSPVVSLPKLQYFNESGEFAAFGTAGYDSEWAIRIPANDMNVYEGMEIRTFHFLPTGPQTAYELRLYHGDKDSRGYDAEPFYTQSIDPATLQYGTVNTIEIAAPQPLPADSDLLVALLISQRGNDNMLGISHDGFRAGYTDLCRIVDVHDRFVSIAEESSETTEIVIPLGVGLGTEESVQASVVRNYEVSDNGQVVGTVDGVKYRIEGVDEGDHTYAVRAVYMDGEYAEAVSLDYNLKNNENAYVAVDDVIADVNGDSTASLSWGAPLNDDRTDIHWGDMQPSPGLVNYGYPVFTVGSIYPVTMTNAYAEEYEITHLYYYPTAPASFRLSLDDNIGTVLFDDTFTPVVNQFNLVELPEPVTIDQSTNYRFFIDIDGCPEGMAPMAYDSSNTSRDWYSNLINAGNELMTLDGVVGIGEHPSWLMGLVIRQKNAPEMPLEGYNVILDGQKANATLLTDCRFTTEPLDQGEHTVAVDVVYDSDRTVGGVPVSFSVDANGINEVTIGEDAARYDIQGRRIVSDKTGRQLFIIGNKKYLNIR